MSPYIWRTSILNAKCMKPPCKNADVKMVCKFTNSKKAEGLTPNESISNWFDCGDKSIWKINTIKLIPIKAQVTTGFLTVGFFLENGKKTNIYLIETSDSINW